MCYLSASDLDTVNVADSLQQVVTLVDNDHVALKSNAARFPRRLVQQRIVRQNNKLQPAYRSTTDKMDVCTRT